jgi:hypothetical protein
VANTAAGGSERPRFPRLHALFSATFWSLPTADPERRWRTARADARAIRSHRSLWGLGIVLVVVASEILGFATKLHGPLKAILIAIGAGGGAVFVIWLGSWLVALAITTRRQRNEAVRQRDDAGVEVKELRRQLDEALAPKPIDNIAPLFGTELRDIRRKIERVKVTNPPSYPREFQLPGARWTEYGPVLAELRPELYVIVERAYTAAHDVNENLRTRESRQRATNPPQLGAIPEDGLDEAHGLAGEALDALGQKHNEPIKSALQTASEQIVGDIVRETLSQLIREGELLYDSHSDYDQWIAKHAAWRERLQDELTDADRVRAFDFDGLSEGTLRHERDLEPARRRVDRIVGNLRKLHDEYYRGER